MRIRRFAVIVACALGLGVSPAFAASLTVASNNLTTFHECVLTAIATASTVSVDSFVNQASTAQNNGTTATMTVNSSSGSKNTRTYVQFDLTKCSPTIPSTATIRIATLRLYATVVPAVCRTHDIFRVTSAWTEAGITWANQPFGTTSNNPASGSATAQMVIGTGCAANTGTNVYVTGWTVTTDVAAYLAGTATNDGWMIRDDVEDSTTARNSTYESSEVNTASKGPQLVIDYTT
jgi:hypothetical protein